MATIAVTTAGTVAGDVTAWVQSCIGSSFAMSTLILAALPAPAYAYDAARNQFSSTLMLRDAVPRRPADAVKILVLTGEDIFIPMLSFVYGQAQLDGPAAVLSLARLRQEFYGLPSNQPLFMLRIRKEVQHELGHTFGLTHCQDPLCTMRISTNIQQLDSKHAEFCSACEVLLHDAVAAAGGELGAATGGTR